MYGQPEGMEQITNQPNWRGDYEREYRKYVDPSLLPFGELPRAISAPPYMQDRLAVSSANVLNAAANLEGMDSFTDVRYDDDYAAFYECAPDKANLPPPIDRDTLYNADLSVYLAQQQFKDTSQLHAPGNRFPTMNHPFAMRLGSQSSLNRSLETVQEQHYEKKLVDEQLAKAITQMQVGNEIQRPGSQPAPNLLQAAIAAGAGHIRSASAFPKFDVDAFASMSTTVPSATSSPAPVASFNSGLPPSANEYMNSQVPPGANMIPGSLEQAYQAAYQAAFIQSQNNPQLVMQQQAGMNVTGGNFSNGLSSHAIKSEMQAALPARDHQMHNYFGQSHQAAQQDLDYTRGPRFNVYEDTSAPVRREERHGKRYNNRRERERDMSYGTNDVYYDGQYLKFNTIEEVVGQVIQVAQDQNGCRFLQRKFDEGGAQTIAFVFPEILENITHLMKDPFGNYLIQKLLDRCSEEQRTEVVKTAAEKGELVTIALSTHGTRAVQKLIETLTTKEQRMLAIEALKPGVVHLIKDLNGNHVVQRCLQRLGPEDSQFIYDAAVRCCVEIASHRHGCCVLQRCIDFAAHEQRTSLIMEISANALVLSQDAFGNYVVQYVLDLSQTEASQRIMTVLGGHYADLAVQKFSSNVVEKCLKLGGLDDARESIIRELMHSPSLPRLLQDPYGNYVIQSALTVTSGSLHQSLVEAIRPYLPSLRGTPHGKRILQKVLQSLKDPFQP